MVLNLHLLIGLLFATHPTLTYFANILPLGADGNLAVYIFFVVSGFALSIQFIKNHDRVYLLQATIRRYFRLMPPIFFSSLFSYFLLYYGQYKNQQLSRLLHSRWLGFFFDFSPSLLDFFRFSLFDVFFSYNEALSYNGVLWTMSYEYYGSILIFATLAIFGRHKVRIVAYFVLSIFFFKTPYLAFIIGMFLAEIYQKQIWFSFFQKNTTYALIPFVIGLAANLFSMKIVRTSHILTGISAIFVFSTMVPGLIRSFMETSFSRFLGKLSFPIYLIHLPIILSFSCSIIYSRGNGWMISTMTGIVTYMVVLYCAMIFYRIVEQPSISISNKIANYIIEKADKLKE
jgi:peptidoglycan/LPS O-acetylase OafA/YrhL